MSRYRGTASTTLYIRNISDRVRYDDLRRLFAKYGRVLDVTIPLDYYSGLPKGFCFVEYEDPRDAEEAQYRMDRQRLFGREIEVEFARGDRKTPGEMRTRDRDRPSRHSRHPEYDRRGERHDRRTRSRSGGRDRRGRERIPRSREGSYRSRSRSRATRSPPKHKSPSPRNKSVSKERSVSKDRSESRSRGSPEPRKRDVTRSPRTNENSRSPSPV
ncbi:serine arginine-rich splicing factor 12 [Brachionus plicatilis]|uniref:Serine arginine-rich splicing factor 12 n=1 Tax=Brachionus plicatilis TaxID=10195 RepID=A0A3M7RMD8_BRAPC|nr:serine arginine-rich splicing factor 12 [Brachionus plicatilis]